MTTTLLAQDAKNRALRTFLTGLAIDVLVGVALVLTTYFASANSWGDLEWTILAFSLLKSVAQAAGAFVLRQFLDGSGFPTPLPPAPVAAPNDRVARARNEYGYAVLGAVGVGLVLLAVLLAVLVLVKAVAISWVAVIVIGVIGVVLVALDGRGGNRVV